MPNQKLDWSDWIILIAREGLPLAAELWTKWTSKKDPTDADWIDLRVAANQLASDRMIKVLTEQGIDPASPQGQALLALTKKV